MNKAGAAGLIYIFSALVTAYAIYQTSPFFFNNAKSDSGMALIPAAFIILLIFSLAVPGWTIYQRKFKEAVLLSALAVIIPLLWLVATLTLTVS